MTARILIVDDEGDYARLFAARQRLRRPGLEFEVCTSPRDALLKLGGGFDLLIVDLDMPEMSGREFLDTALAAGFDGRKVVINSSHEAEELHSRFSLGECLAVVNKLDTAQQSVLDMILDNLEARKR